MEQLTERDKELLYAAEAWRPFLIRRLGDLQRADEAVQLVREQVWFARDRFDPTQGSPRVWVGGFARIIALERLRARHSAREVTDVSWDTIGVREDQHEAESVDEHRQLLQLIARHVPAEDWEVVSTHAFARSTANAEARSIGISVNAHRAALQRVQSTAETVRAVIALIDGGGGVSREDLKVCISPRLGIATVVPWMDEAEGAKLAATALKLSVSVVRNRLASARRLLAVAEAVAAEVAG